MNTSTFLISNYINNYSNDKDLNEFCSKIYSRGVLSKDYPDDNLLLLYNRYDSLHRTPLDRECRSVILDRNSLEIVCYTCNTPICNLEALNYLVNKYDSEKEYYQCYEGPLLSLFYHNDKWYISTRRCLDSSTSIWKNKSHYDLFMDIIIQDNYQDFDSFTDNLNTNYCYYFVLLHHENRNIVNYTEQFGSNYKKMCLVFIRSKEDQMEIDMEAISPNLKFISDNIFLPEKLDDLEKFDEENRKCDMTNSPKSEGVIIKIKKNNNNCLLKLQNIAYQFYKAIGSEKNIYRGFIHLYQTGKLLEFFNNNNNISNYKKIVNPLNLHEAYDTVGTVDAVFKVCTSELYELFKLLWDIKSSGHQNTELYNLLPKEYKDILFGIRGLYFKKKSKYFQNKKNNSSAKNDHLKIRDIYQHLKSIPSENIESLLRIRKLMFNWVKIEPKVKLFGKISEQCDKVHYKLTAIYTNKLFPDIMPDDLPVVNN